MSERDHFDISPQQYHAGLDKLWHTLGVKGTQDEDVFTLSSKEILKLRKWIEENVKCTCKYWRCSCPGWRSDPCEKCLLVVTWGGKVSGHPGLKK